MGIGDPVVPGQGVIAGRRAVAVVAPADHRQAVPLHHGIALVLLLHLYLCPADGGRGGGLGGHRLQGRRLSQVQGGVHIPGAIPLLIGQLLQHHPGVDHPGHHIPHDLLGPDPPVEDLDVVVGVQHRAGIAEGIVVSRQQEGQGAPPGGRVAGQIEGAGPVDGQLPGTAAGTPAEGDGGDGQLQLLPVGQEGKGQNHPYTPAVRACTRRS